MADIESPKLLFAKGGLLLFLGGLASTLLLMENPSFRVAILLAIAVWAFARAYYFAFYVIEHYIDETFKFAGLISFLGYAIGRRTTEGSALSHDDREPENSPIDGNAPLT